MYETPIVYAAARGQYEMVSQLLKQGAGVNYSDENGRTALFRACAAGHIRCVELLLDAGADVNIGDDYLTTPLMTASENGRVECVKLLVKFGADVNAGEFKYGRTSLLMAAWAKSSECVNFLLQNGVDVNAVDDCGENALMIATGRRSLNCVAALLKAEAHVNIRNTNGSKALENKSLNLRLATMLYAAGETIDDSINKENESKTLLPNRPLLDWLKESKAKLSLMDSSREVIRKHLLIVDPHRNLFDRVPKLGLPAMLNNYLLYNVSLGGKSP